MVRAWRRVRLVVVGLCLLAVPPRSVAAQEVVEYYALDALGSVRVVFDAAGTVIGRMDYDPFGAPLGPGVNLSSRAYAGLFRDGEAGLDFAQARSYQVRTGRFSTVDPIYAGLFAPQAWNRYAYAVNNPAGMLDPSGKSAESGLSRFCGAEFSFNDCGGEEMFWDTGGGAGFEFGGDFARAVRRGFVPEMPFDVWTAFEAFDQQANAAFADARSPKPSVTTDYSIRLEDGTTVVTSGGSTGPVNPFVQLSQDVVRRAGAFTEPQIYVEIVLVSAFWGTAGRFVLKDWYYNPHVQGVEKAWSKDFRTGWHRLPEQPGRWWSGRSLPHYHRRPGIGRHRPYEGW